MTGKVQDAEDFIQIILMKVSGKKCTIPHQNVGGRDRGKPKAEG